MNLRKQIADDIHKIILKAQDDVNEYLCHSNVPMESNARDVDTKLSEMSSEITHYIARLAALPKATEQGHIPNTFWTIRIQSHGQMFHISHIMYEDIARSAAKGIQADNPAAIIDVYLAASVAKGKKEGGQ